MLSTKERDSEWQCISKTHSLAPGAPLPSRPCHGTHHHLALWMPGDAGPHGSPTSSTATLPVARLVALPTPWDTDKRCLVHSALTNSTTTLSFANRRERQSGVTDIHIAHPPASGSVHTFCRQMVLSTQPIRLPVHTDYPPASSSVHTDIQQEVGGRLRCSPNILEQGGKPRRQNPHRLPNVRPIPQPSPPSNLDLLEPAVSPAHSVTR